MSNIVLAIDASWYLHRAFHVLRFRRNFTNLHRVIPGQVLSMIVKDALDVHATHVAVCFDAARSFRYDLYPRYKEGRTQVTLEKVLGDPKVTADIPQSVLNTNVYSFLKEVRSTVVAAGFKALLVKRMESDDLMAAVATTFKGRRNVQVLLATRDKDLMQVVGNNVFLYWPRSGQREAVLVDSDEVVRQRGVSPAQVRDQLCIMGDSVDSVPGIPLYSLKKSAALLAEHGSISKALKAVGKGPDVLRANLGTLKRARALVNLDTKCWRGTLSDLAIGHLDSEKLVQLVGYVNDKLKALHNEATVASKPGLFK